MSRRRPRHHPRRVAATPVRPRAPIAAPPLAWHRAEATPWRLCLVAFAAIGLGLQLLWLGDALLQGDSPVRAGGFLAFLLPAITLALFAWTYALGDTLDRPLLTLGARAFWSPQLVLLGVSVVVGVDHIVRQPRVPYDALPLPIGLPMLSLSLFLLMASLAGEVHVRWLRRVIRDYRGGGGR